MAHSWVQMFDTEYEAFKTYCQLYPPKHHPVGRYLQHLGKRSPNAIRAFQEVLLPRVSPILPFDWIPEIFPICPRKRGKCWMTPD